MRKPIVLLDFIRLSVPEKINFYRNVIQLISNNTMFPQPDVTLAALTVLTDTLELDSQAAESGAHAAVAKLDKSEKAADDAFRKLARYVDRIADGDTVTILASGFHMSKQPEPAQRPQFAAEAGKSAGTIELTRKAQPGARSYVWQYCIGSLPVNGDGSWIFAGAGTKASYEITGLESGAKCWFRVAAVTTEGMAPWCDPIMKVVP